MGDDVHLLVARELATRLDALDDGDIAEPVAVATRPTPTAARHSAPSISSPAGVREVGEAPLVVGRSGADVQIPSPLVSRRHAQVWADGDALLCRDLGSTNGTVRVRDGSATTVGTAASSLLLPGDVLTTAAGVELLTVLDAIS